MNKMKRHRENKLNRDTTERINVLYECRVIVCNAFKSEIFPLKPTEGTVNPGLSACIANVFDCLHLKILASKQMLQRLPIAFVLVRAGNTSENLLNKIRQIIDLFIDQNKLLKIYTKI